MIQNVFDSLIHVLEILSPSIGGNPILLYISALSISTLLFFVFREIILWYWKVNRIVSNLERIHASIEDTNSILRYNSKQNSSAELLKKELAREKSSLF